MTARRPAGAPAPMHSDAAHAAITAELVACTLGARRRLELRTDLAGRLRAALRRAVDQSRSTPRWGKRRMPAIEASLRRAR